MFSIVALALLLIFSSPGAANALLRSLEDQYSDVSIDTAPQAQAIVVLGGAIHIPDGRHAGSGLLEPTGRVLRAMRRYRAGPGQDILAGARWIS